MVEMIHQWFLREENHVLSSPYLINLENPSLSVLTKFDLLFFTERVLMMDEKGRDLFCLEGLRTIDEKGSDFFNCLSLILIIDEKGRLFFLSWFFLIVEKKEFLEASDLLLQNVPLLGPPSSSSPVLLRSFKTNDGGELFLVQMKFRLKSCG